MEKQVKPPSSTLESIQTEAFDVKARKNDWPAGPAEIRHRWAANGRGDNLWQRKREFQGIFVLKGILGRTSTRLKKK